MKFVLTILTFLSLGTLPPAAFSDDHGESRCTPYLNVECWCASCFQQFLERKGRREEAERKTAYIKRLIRASSTDRQEYADGRVTLTSDYPADQMNDEDLVRWWLWRQEFSEGNRHLPEWFPHRVTTIFDPKDPDRPFTRELEVLDDHASWQAVDYILGELKGSFGHEITSTQLEKLPAMSKTESSQ